MRGEAGITTAKRRALTILHAFEEADGQLVGKAVVLTDGKAGRWKPSGSTKSTAYESRSKAPREVACLDHQIRAKLDASRTSARFNAVQEQGDGSLSPQFLNLWTGCDAVELFGSPQHKTEEQVGRNCRVL
jgi:hypothetical protein